MSWRYQVPATPDSPSICTQTGKGLCTLVISITRYFQYEIGMTVIICEVPLVICLILGPFSSAQIVTRTCSKPIKETTRAKTNMPQEEQELYKNLKRISWQFENCLSCIWFKPNDPINADLFERGQCIHSKLKEFDLIVSGRDWCNLFKEIPQKTIDTIQEKAMK